MEKKGTSFLKMIYRIRKTTNDHEIIHKAGSGNIHTHAHTQVRTEQCSSGSPTVKEKKHEGFLSEGHNCDIGIKILHGVFLSVSVRPQLLLW